MTMLQRNLNPLCLVARGFWVTLLLAGCNQANQQQPMRQTREMRIQRVLDGYGDKDFRTSIDMASLQELAQQDWADQQAGLLKGRTDIENWAQDAMKKWEQMQPAYEAEVKKQLSDNQQLIRDKAPKTESGETPQGPDDMLQGWQTKP